MSVNIAGWIMVIVGLVAVIVALHRMGPEPEIGAADYKQMQCEYWENLKECRTNKNLIAEK